MENLGMHQCWHHPQVWALPWTNWQVIWGAANIDCNKSKDGLVVSKTNKTKSTFNLFNFFMRQVKEETSVLIWHNKSKSKISKKILWILSILLLQTTRINWIWREFDHQNIENRPHEGQAWTNCFTCMRSKYTLHMMCYGTVFWHLQFLV